VLRKFHFFILLVVPWSSLYNVFPCSVCDGHLGVTFEEVLMLQGLRERECWL